MIEHFEDWQSITFRRAQVLALLATSHTEPEIAAELGISRPRRIAMCTNSGRRLAARLDANSDGGGRLRVRSGWPRWLLRGGADHKNEPGRYMR